MVSAVRECADARSDQWTVNDLLQHAGTPRGHLALDWPMTARARCHSCGHEWEPLLRRARFQRQTCPACGAADLVEVEVLSSLTAGSRWSERTLKELGLPLGHVHEIADDGNPDARVHVEMTGDLPLVRSVTPC
jgi:hypothetical protein